MGQLSKSLLHVWDLGQNGSILWALSGRGGHGPKKPASGQQGLVSRRGNKHRSQELGACGCACSPGASPQSSWTAVVPWPLEEGIATPLAPPCWQWLGGVWAAVVLSPLLCAYLGCFSAVCHLHLVWLLSLRGDHCLTSLQHKHKCCGLLTAQGRHMANLGEINGFASFILPKGERKEKKNLWVPK